MVKKALGKTEGFTSRWLGRAAAPRARSQEYPREICTSHGWSSGQLPELGMAPGTAGRARRCQNRASSGGEGAPARASSPWGFAGSQSWVWSQSCQIQPQDGGKGCQRWDQVGPRKLGSAKRREGPRAGSEQCQTPTGASPDLWSGLPAWLPPSPLFLWLRFGELCL